MPESTPLPKASYVNVEVGLGRVRGNTKIYARMLGLFLKSEEFAQLEQSLEAGDIERAADLAHAIKGMTGNLALDALFELSTKMMGQLREGVADRQTAEELFSALAITRKYVEEELVELGEA